MRSRKFTRVAAATAATLSLVGAATAAAQATTTATASGIVFTVHPPMAKASGITASKSLTPSACLKQTGAFACQTPSSIRAAYDIPTEIDGEAAGTGQTIVIVDAFGSPTLMSDLATFDARFGLPAAHVNILYPDGKPTWQGTANEVGWAEETSLDVQWAHAVAPGATIDLVVASTNYGSSLNNAEQYAVSNHLGNVMSMSFGVSEASINGNNSQVQQSHAIYEQARGEGMTVFASSGDDGSDNGAGYGNFGYPAADPNVTAVGGTTLLLGTPGKHDRETVWGDFSGCPFGCVYGPLGATGGAQSILDATVGGKDGSDVSYNAAVYTGVLTYLGFLGPQDNGFYFFGGTSAGSPQWAAATAVIDQAVGRSVGFLNDKLPGLAKVGALHDVTKGDNTTPTFAGGYAAGPGHEQPTGYGTPDVAAIISSLAS